MATARDQVEAYNFAARRQVLALLQGDDTATVDPRRRLNRSFMGGLLLAVVALAVVGVAGFLSGGGAAAVPKDGVIVATDTGGAYVLENNVLHPALNLASAKLIAGNKITNVESGALSSLPRGLPVGIPGAPDSLPSPSRLSRGLWTVCSTAPEATDARPRVVVSIGARRPAPLAEGAAIVVRTPDRQSWLVDGGLRYRITPQAGTLLGLDRVAQVPVLTEVLDLIPEAAPLRVPTVPGAGSTPSVSLPFTVAVGDLVKVDNGTRQPSLYVVLDDGVASVDPFAFTMLAGSARTTVRAAASQVVKVASRTRPPLPVSWPRQAVTSPEPPPALGEPLCITYNPAAAPNGAAWPVTVSEPATVPLPAQAQEIAPAAGSLPTAATGVAVPGGSGVLARATATGGVDGVFTLVTDSGLRFGITNADAVNRLGYPPASAVRVPLPFVALLPSGPGLDPTAASAEYAGAANAPRATAPRSGVPASSSSAAPSGAPSGSATK